MGNQVVGTTIEVVGSDNVVTILHDVLQRIGDGGGTRGYGQTSYTTLEGCYTIFEYALCRVGKTTIDVTCITKSETVGSMLAVVEHIRCGLIDRHGTCVGCGVGLFLTYMELKGLKTIIFLCTHNLVLSILLCL